MWNFFLTALSLPNEIGRSQGCRAFRFGDHGWHASVCRHAVPLQNLIDSLEGGESIDDFLDGFPSVKREQAVAVIEAARFKMMELV